MAYRRPRKGHEDDEVNIAKKADAESKWASDEDRFAAFVRHDDNADELGCAPCFVLFVCYCLQNIYILTLVLCLERMRRRKV